MWTCVLGLIYLFIFFSAVTWKNTDHNKNCVVWYICMNKEYNWSVRQLFQMQQEGGGLRELLCLLERTYQFSPKKYETWVQTLFVFFSTWLKMTVHSLTMTCPPWGAAAAAAKACLMWSTGKALWRVTRWTEEPAVWTQTMFVGVSW